MPSGAKKRKALRKKQQQEAAIGTSTNNGDNLLHGHGSQEEKESDSSLSSPGSQENEEFGRKDPSAPVSSGLGKGSAKEISGDVDVTQELGPKSGNAVAVDRRTDYNNNVVEKSPDSSSQNLTHTANNVAAASGLGKGSAKVISGDADVTQGLGPKSGNAIIDERGTDYKKNVVEISPSFSSQNSTQTAKNVSSQDASGLVKGSAKEISRDADVTQGLGPKSGNGIAADTTSFKKNVVEKSPNSSSQNCAHAAKDVVSQDGRGNSVSEIVPAVRSHVKPAVPEKSELVETSAQSNLVKQNGDENGVSPSPGLEKENNKVVNCPKSAAETSKKVESVREPEVPVSSEEKRLLLPGPQVVRTSWLSCCGLFDVMSGSDR